MLGSLSVLSALESQATEQERREAGEKWRQHDRRHQLQKIRQLKQRRDELLQMLHDKADSETGSGNGSQRDLGEGEERDERRSALAYVAELKEKLQVYKMTGAWVVKTDADSKVLCLPTSYRRVYLSSYHLQLHRQASGTFKVVHHDLPPFLVHTTLPPDLEVKDVGSAVRPLQEALTMFVLRREELKEAQGEFKDSLHVAESSAVLDYLNCSLDIGPQVSVDISLKYTDLNHYLPSSVSAVLVRKDGGRRRKESLPQDLVDNIHSDFCSHRLCVALSQTTGNVRSYLQTFHPHCPDNSL